MAAMQSSPPVRQERDGAVLVLTLDRAERRNALSEEMMSALQAALDAASVDETVRAVILAASGPAFCAGHDLKEMTARRNGPGGGREYFASLFAQCAHLMQSIVRLPKPVIAAVQGVATAAGCQLVASCDLAVASEDARFATPGVNIGLFCSTPMVALSRNVARKHAMEMLLTGDFVNAGRARETGLVNRVVPAAMLGQEARNLAHQIAKKSRASIVRGKAAFYRQAEMDLASAYSYAAEVMTENMLEAEARDGIAAFIERRPPPWA